MPERYRLFFALKKARAYSASRILPAAKIISVKDNN